MQEGTFTGVALGAGDPEFITLKAYKALQKADVIFFPVSSLDGDEIQSFSALILDALEIENLCKPLLFPMKGKDMKAYYEKAFEEIKEAYNQGLHVVLVSEGDLLFYSTFGYVLELAKAAQIPCKLISGIPAFISASALGNRPLVEKTQGLEVVAKPENFEVVSRAIKDNKAVVVMKMKVLEGWYEFLRNCDREFLYAERVGTPNEFSTSNIEDLRLRKIPYFALLIIYPKK